MSNQEKIIQGKYHYLRDGELYSEENFTIAQETKINGNYIFDSEILLRVATGEFLKILCRYIVSHSFEPINIRTHRVLGVKESTEEYSIDHKTNTVTYTFDGINGKHQSDKIVMGRPHFTTPAFLTSMLMTYAKKIDPMHKTHYQITTSENIWEYKSDFVMHDVHVQLESIKPVKVKIASTELTATHCSLMQLDAESNIIGEPHHFYLSKFFLVPYKADFGNGLTIQVQFLREVNGTYKGMF